MSQPVIEFYKLRDFGAKMNATIEFLRENIGRLFLNLLFIAGPVALLMSLLMTNLTTKCGRIDDGVTGIEYQVLGLEGR